MENQVTSYLEDSLSVVSSIVANKGLQSKIEQLALLIVSSLKKGGKIMFIGNGGSAADSQHMAAEYVSRFAFDRKGLPGIALTTDTSILTAIGNDYSFDNVFSRQLNALGNEGDILIAYSTSGRSLNIVKAINEAKSMGIYSVLFTGLEGSALSNADLTIASPSSSTPHIQEGHLILGHLLCYLVEKLYFKG
ncbi:SIS domain-containing protein [Parasutterella sp.]|jgi:phosphoheptose isomerase|uniref:D-sedoheptulose-7-phosphate isomerase n=1 Tax=Parasutterella sp. TaxID=2049037 RepID=UPI003520F500